MIRACWALSLLSNYANSCICRCFLSPLFFFSFRAVSVTAICLLPSPLSRSTSPTRDRMQQKSYNRLSFEKNKLSKYSFLSPFLPQRLLNSSTNGPPDRSPASHCAWPCKHELCRCMWYEWATNQGAMNHNGSTSLINCHSPSPHHL